MKKQPAGGSHGRPRRSTPSRNARAIAALLERAFEESQGHEPYRLGPTQSLFISAVVILGEEDAYNERIKEYLHSRHRKEVNDGQLSSIAKTLRNHHLIAGTNGGSPKGKGRPVTLYRVTDLGIIAMRATAKYIRAMQQERPLHAQTKAFSGENAGHERGGGTLALRRPPRVQ